MMVQHSGRNAGFQCISKRPTYFLVDDQENFTKLSWEHAVSKVTYAKKLQNPLTPVSMQVKVISYSLFSIVMH